MLISAVASCVNKQKIKRMRAKGEHRQRPVLDALEDRSLLTTINEYPVPLLAGSGVSGLSGITTGPDGNLWFTEDEAGKIGRMTPSGALTEFALPFSSCQPNQIVTGPDGNLWFTEDAATPIGNGQDEDHIGRITPDGTITKFGLPTVFSGPLGIATGLDGNVWFTESAATLVSPGQFRNFIGRITPDGTITEFQVPTPYAEPLDIVVGSDGNLWFTEFNGQAVERITPSGVISEFRSASFIGGLGITTGPDGNLWLTQSTGSYVVRLTTAGAATFYSTPTPNAYPLGITVGPDGNIWFSEDNVNNIGEIFIDPTTMSLAAPSVTYGAHGLVTVTVAGPSPSVMPSGTVFLTVDSKCFMANLNDGSATFDVGVLPAGSYEVTATFANQLTFQASSASSALQISPATLTVTAVNQAMKHGDPVLVLTAAITGFVNGDTASVVSGSASLSTMASSSGTPGKYPISIGQGSLSAANYTFNVVNGSLVVQPKVVDVRVDYGSKSISLLGLTRDLPFIDIQAVDVIFCDSVSVTQGTLALNGVNLSPFWARSASFTFGNQPGVRCRGLSDRTAQDVARLASNRAIRPHVVAITKLAS
jgi:streptogramin lyase